MALRASLGADFADFNTALKNVELKLKDTGDIAKNVGRDLSKMVEGFRGTDIMRQAELAAAGIDKIGGVSRLTEAEQRKVNATITEAIAKYRALGQEVPPHLQKIATETGKVGTATQGMASSFSKFQGLAGTLGLAFSATAVIGFGKALLDDADALVKLSDKTGIAIEPLQRLKYAAEQSGNTLENVTTSISMMQQRLGDGDKSAVVALGKLGLAFEDIRAMSPNQQFEAIAREVAKIEDPMQRASIATDLFGKSGKEILPTLISDIQKLGDEAPKMSEKATRAFDDIGDAWNRTYATLKNKVGEGLATAFDGYARLAQGAGALVRMEFGKAAEIMLDLSTAIPKVTVHAAPLQVGMTSVALSMEAADRVGKELDASLKKVTKSTTDATPPARTLAQILADMGMSAGDAAPKIGLLNGKLVGLGQSMQRGLSFTGWADPMGATAGFDAMITKAREAAAATEAVRKAFGDLAVTLPTAPGGNMTTPDLGASGAQAAESWGAGFQKIAQGFPDLIVSAFTGSGDWANAIGAVGSQVGSLIGSKIGKSLGTSIGGVLGETLGSLLPGIGAMLGPLLEGITSKLFKTEGKKVNDIRDAYVAAAGGIGALNAAAVAAGTTLDAMLKAGNVKDYEAAIKALDASLKFLTDTATKYNLTWRDFSDPAKITAGFGDELGAIVKEYEALTGAGYDWTKVVDGMAGSFQKLVTDAMASGQALPAWMEPIITHLREVGLLTDANSGKIDAINAKYKEQADALSGVMKGLTDELVALNASEAPEEVMGVIEEMTRKRIDEEMKVTAAKQAELEKQKQAEISKVDQSKLDFDALFADVVSKSGSAAADVAKQWADPPWKDWTPPPNPYGSAPVFPQAAGGDYLVTRPTLFLAGEAGPERATFSGAGRTEMGGGSSRPIEITLNLTTTVPVDGQVLARTVKKYLPNELALSGI